MLLLFLLTFNEINIIMVVIPNIESPRVALLIFFMILDHVSINSFPLPGSPRRDLTWLLEIVKAAAVVKPTITGMETKSTRKPGGDVQRITFYLRGFFQVPSILPKLRTPKRNIMIPPRKAHRTA